MDAIKHVWILLTDVLSHPLAVAMIPILATRWLDDMARRAKERRDRK